MDSLLQNPIFWSAVITASGTIILAVVTKRLNKPNDAQTFAQSIRDELRKDIERYQKEVAGYKEETAGLRKEVDDWRSRYFELDREHNKTINALEEQIEDLKRVLHEHGINYTDLS